MNTIQSQWEIFSKMAVPAGAPDYQVKSMQRCFYAGAAAFLQIQFHITNDGISEDSGVAMYKTLVEELQGFVIDNGGHA